MPRRRQLDRRRVDRRRVDRRRVDRRRLDRRQLDRRRVDRRRVDRRRLDRRRLDRRRLDRRRARATRAATSPGALALAARVLGALALSACGCEGGRLAAPDARAAQGDAASATLDAATGDARPAPDTAPAPDAARIDAAPAPDAPGPDARPLPSSAYHVPLELANTGADVADPHCIRADGTWYLYLTSGGANLEAWTSADLLSWTYGGVIWEPTAGTWNDVSSTGSFGVWAPSVHRGPDGKFYLYYTAALRIGLARADTPLGPFVDLLDHPLLGDGNGGVGDGVLLDASRTNFATDFEEFSIDAFLLERPTGERVLYAVRYTPLSVIVAWPMLGMVTLASTTPTVVAQPDVLSWEGPIVEGPFVEEHDGGFQLTYSGNTFLTTGYALGVALAATPFGPFTKDPGNPFLATGDAPDLFGPGHHSFVDGPDGLPLVFYHAKRDGTAGANRQIRFGPVRFGAAPPVEVLFP